MSQQHHMPAASPYAPSSRNSFLRRSSSSSLAGNGHGTGHSTAVMAIFLVIIRFWKDRRQAMWENIVQKPSTWLVEMIRSISLPPLAIKRSQGRNVDSTASSSELTVQRFKENLELINDVLYYWFGQYPPDTAQKMLWMIASSSKEHQKKVDQEIADKFETLLWELSADQENGKGESVTRWKEWCLDLDGIYGVRGKIAAIVVLDQFSRHILRHRKRKNSSPTTTQQSSLDHLALRTAQLCVECHAQEIHCGMVSLPMYIFALMPYRHTNTMDKVHFVQQCIEEASCLNAQLEAMLGRFRKATSRRMALLQDEARRTGKAQEPSSTDTNSQLVATTKGAKRHDEDDIQFTDDDILETFPFEADLKLARNHPIHTTIVKFLADQGIHSTDKDSTNVGERKQKARREIPSLSPARPAAVAVSLSGGVDSMVIASVLSHLQKSCGYQHLHIVAVHIDYANRPESGAEAAFVERYCRDYLGSIDFMCRRIGEVTRGITAREDYERIARTIRYEMYRDAVAKAHTLLEGGEGIVGVMLGHHRGDLRENVLSNAHKGCGPLDLSGMTSVSKNDGIVVYRPLLPLEKSFVLDYAHKFGVPYFKDTTPHWSTRGKLRNKLLPLLEDIYGDGSMNNLSNLAVESDECRALLQQSIIGPFMDAIVRKPMGIILDTAPWKDQPDFFWKFVLREALHSASLGMFSDKSVLEFLKRVKADTVKSAWLQCRKDYGVYLQDDGKAFVLYPSSFPWNKKDVFGMEGQTLDFDTDTRVGPWRIRAEIFEGSSFQDALETPTDWLGKKAISSMEAFMDGHIEYYVEAPTWMDKKSPRPLVFHRFSKADRPQAWKNSDLRIQSTLPLVCNDEVAASCIKGIRANIGGEEMDQLQLSLIRVVLELQLSSS